MRCCNLINSLITGFPPDPVPDPDNPAFLWYAELEGITWNSFDTITINGVSADVGMDDPSLASAMQGQFGADTSGAWMVTSGLTTFIWVYQTDEPVVAAVNVGTGLPIPLTWNQGDTLVEACWDTTINVSDPAGTSPQDMVISVGSLILYFNLSGATFDNPAIDTVLLNVVHQTFGANASMTIVDVGGGDYHISVFNTLVIPIQLTTTNAESGLFFEIPCP